MAYTFTEDYNADFSRHICAIVSESSADPAEDIAKVQQLTDDYVEYAGERPDYRELDELASLLRFGRRGLTNRKKAEVKKYENETEAAG